MCPDVVFCRTIDWTSVKISFHDTKRILDFPKPTIRLNDVAIVHVNLAGHDAIIAVHRLIFGDFFLVQKPVVFCNLARRFVVGNAFRISNFGDQLCKVK